MPHPKNIKAPSRVIYGTCETCGRHSPMCAKVHFRDSTSLMCSTCRLANMGEWYTVAGWDDGIPREHEPSNKMFREWAAKNAPLDDFDFETDDRRMVSEGVTEK